MKLFFFSACILSNTDKYIKTGENDDFKVVEVCRIYTSNHRRQVFFQMFLKYANGVCTFKCTTAKTAFLDIIDNFSLPIT